MLPSRDFLITTEDIKQVVKVIQPFVEIVRESDYSLTLEGKFISMSGTDDITYFTGWGLQSASFGTQKQRRTYVYRP